MTDREKLRDSFTAVITSATSLAEARVYDLADELSTLALAAINAPSTERTATQPEGEWTAEDQREQEYFDRHPTAPSASTEQPAAASESIASNEFLGKLLAWINVRHDRTRDEAAYHAIIAHIDAHTARRVAELVGADAEGSRMVTRIMAEANDARKERDDLRAKLAESERKILELSRVYTERGLQITRLETALGRTQLARPVDLAGMVDMNATVPPVLADIDTLNYEWLATEARSAGFHAVIDAILYAKQAKGRLAAQAEAIQRMSAAWADLAGLTRYSAVVGRNGFVEMASNETGKYLRESEVQALLAGGVASGSAM